MQKLRQDNRGIATAVIIIIVVVVAAIGGVGWYVMSNKDKDKTNSNDSAATSAADLSECQKEINDEEFCKFATSFKSLGSYKSTINTSGVDGAGIIDIEADASGNSSLVTKQDGAEVAAYISLDDATYIKDYTDNSWLKYAATDSTEVPNITDDVRVDFSQADVPEAQRITYKKITEEACGEQTCLKYQIIDPAQPTANQFIWFDTKEHKLRRWSSTDGTTTTDMTISYEAVTIAVPSPVKEAPQGLPPQ